MFKPHNHAAYGAVFLVCVVSTALKVGLTWYTAISRSHSQSISWSRTCTQQQHVERLSASSQPGQAAHNQEAEADDCCQNAAMVFRHCTVPLRCSCAML